MNPRAALKCRHACQSGPDNGHTSGLRLFGSDESDTARRERRRRMRAHRDVGARCLLESGVCDRIDDRNGHEPDQQLLASITAFDEWRGDWSSAFFRNGATGLVRAALRLAGFMTRRIRKNARRGKLERSHQQRQYHRQKDGRCSPHGWYLPHRPRRVERRPDGAEDGRQA